MTASSISLIARQLDPERQREIAFKLIDSFSEGEVVDESIYISTFCELVELVPSIKDELYDKALKYGIKKLRFGDSSEQTHNSLLKLCHHFKKQRFAESLIEFVTSELKEFDRANRRLFNEKVRVLIQETGGTSDLSRKDIERYLEFIEWYFMREEAQSSEIDRLCLIYLTFDDTTISQLASKILKWRNESICKDETTLQLVWNVIFSLLDSNDNYLISFAYILWLRIFNFFGTTKLHDSCPKFQQLMSTEIYWTRLRDGLVSLVHEHKKFALVIVQLSVQSLSTDISMPIMKWENSHRDRYLQNWKRFSTLYEILGIDTAMNQVEAASTDLVKILSPESGIPVSFALTILSVGFKAPTERVKNFALKLAFSLPDSSLSLFEHDFSFLTSAFLPFAMMASHFAVEKTSMEGVEYQCLYGDELSSFISKCMISLNHDENRTSLIHLSLKLMADNDNGYCPARIYLTNGLLQGMKDTNSCCITTENLDLLYSLFEGSADSAIWNRVLQTLYLRLLLYVSSGVSMETMFNSVGYHIRFNGFQLYLENEEFFLDFYNDHYKIEDVLEFFRSQGPGLDLESFMVITSYLLQGNVEASKLVAAILSYPKLDGFLVEGASSGLHFEKGLFHEPLIVNRLGRLIGSMFTLSKEVDSSLYEGSRGLLINKDLFSYDFWTDVEISPLYERIIEEFTVSTDYTTCLPHFYFFSYCVDECLYNENFDLSIPQILEVLRLVLENKVAPYKTKDKLFGLATGIIEQLISLGLASDEKVKRGILESSSQIAEQSEYYSHRGNVRMLHSLLKETDTTVEECRQIVDIIKVIWEDLIRDRLILKQRDLHHEFINLLTNRAFLRHSATDKVLADSILDISSQIIDRSVSRKSLLPPLFKAISDYQLKDPRKFEDTDWLAKLLVKGMFLYQSDDSLFLMDMVLSSFYDRTLNMSSKGLYEQVYGLQEMGYRIFIKAVLSSIKTSRFACLMWDYILTNDEIFHLLNPVRRTDHKEQWKRIQLLALMLTTLDVLEKDKLVKYLEKWIIPRLFKEASPLCRSYIEWIISLTSYRYPDLKEKIFDRFFKKGVEEQHPMTIVLYERIFVLIAMQLSREQESKAISRFLVDTILPSSTSNRALTRHFSSSMACVIWQEIKRKKLIISTDLMKLLENTYRIAVMAVTYGNFRTGDAMVWDIVGDKTLCGINGGMLLKTSDREIDAICEKSWKKYLSPERRTILRIPIGEDEKEAWVKFDRSKEIKLDSYAGREEEALMLQTKSGAWSTVIETDSDSRAASEIRRSSLIVMASLVEKPTNLGGICRLCDCLGAGWMTMNDMRVKEDAEFMSVAVTAERWMPLIEVNTANVVDFMRLKKREGYTLIGLEQTDNSVELNNELKFPKKSLMVLGREREGIPAEILAELDLCVVIKQVGVVRSMNIQTATAVIVQAYSAQHN
ncbi:DEKNAAC102104 [Brettanomyces naardenensis]|uniref:DEKNAAC102104 n=1 Tax=Brettanomyces naardenensis TaxID=13370 RepID=A0A448YJS2_BRENA|nr:DEKNAAC102104 [Brettanomyces naardenensis]